MSAMAWRARWSVGVTVVVGMVAVSGAWDEGVLTRLSLAIRGHALARSLA